MFLPNRHQTLSEHCPNPYRTLTKGYANVNVNENVNDKVNEKENVNLSVNVCVNTLLIGHAHKKQNECFKTS